MRLLLRLGLILMLVLAVVAGSVVYYVDEIASTVIEEGGTRALGVPTRIGGVELRLSEGSLGLTALEVSNPPGFGDAPFFRMQEGHVAITLRSLLEDLIEIPEIALQDIDVHLESRDGRNNYDVLLEGAAEANATEALSATADAGPAFVIRELRIENVSAHIDISLLSRRLTKPLVVTVPEIVLHDVGSQSGGVTIEQLSAIVVSAVLANLSKPGVGLPADVARRLELGARALSISREELQREVKRGASKRVEDEVAKQAAKYAEKELGERAGAAAGAAVRSLFVNKNEAGAKD